ncbi:hypothetical protein TURU_110466 [Turdus rufiventris]|nr:hypothetical protein TURU_110466 [Turdus rufiventris]
MENELGKSVDNQMDKYIVTIMGKSESQMDIVEKSTKSGKKPWSFVAIGLAVLLLLMTCAAVALVILYASSRVECQAKSEYLVFIKFIIKFILLAQERNSPEPGPGGEVSVSNIELGRILLPI